MVYTAWEVFVFSPDAGDAGQNDSKCGYFLRSAFIVNLFSDAFVVMSKESI